MDKPAYRVDPMRVDDLDQIRRIERASFPTPWPRNAYRREILTNERARYIVVRSMDQRGRAPPPPPPPQRGWRRWRNPWALFARRRGDPGDVVAFAGVWVMLDEAHVTTIAVDPSHRRRGLGELLIVEMIKLALKAGAQVMSLEVRMSNEPAQALYRKYGFVHGGVRPRYYSDNFEDALIMRSESLSSRQFIERTGACERSLRARLAWRSFL